MTTHTIDIEGLPEGWDAVAYRTPKDGERVLSDKDGVIIAKCISFPCLIVQKKTRPRRIVLEETGGKTATNHILSVAKYGVTIQMTSDTIWREIKED